MNSYILSFLFSIAVSFIASNGLPKAIIDAFSSGNAKVIAESFASEVDLNINGKEDVYSKSQGELVLKKFFQTHPAKSYTNSHNGKSRSNSYYAIGSLDTSKGKFRTYLLYKKSESKIIIHELRIESDSE